MPDARARFIPLKFTRRDEHEMVERAHGFFELMDRRRSVRFISSDPVPRECVELAVRTASSAPSGAHRQPWHFVIVDDPALKRDIRRAAEQGEAEGHLFPILKKNNIETISSEKMVSELISYLQQDNLKIQNQMLKTVQLLKRNGHFDKDD